MNSMLPHIGRPNTSGISIKLLGESEYHRQLRLEKIRRGKLPAPERRRWTGLHWAEIGHAAYMRAWRQLRRAL